MLTKRTISYVQHVSIYPLPGDQPMVRLALTTSTIGTYQFPCLTVIHDYTPEEARELASDLYEMAQRVEDNGRAILTEMLPEPIVHPLHTRPETPSARHDTLDEYKDKFPKF